MPRHDQGYFPPGKSVLRRVHDQRMVGLLFGQRALMIGALNPLNFTGTLDFTNARERPFQRLAHTGKSFETIFFGTKVEADQVLAFVEKLHGRVKGELSEDAGVTPAGTPYSALDPALMLWTVAVIADSAQYFYELLVRPLSEPEREGLWQDYLLFGGLFGMPPDSCPASYREFRAYWDETLASEAMYLTEEARAIGYATAFEIPRPVHLNPAFRVHDLIMLGSMPPRVREIYELEWTSRQQAAFQVAVRGLRRARPLLPKRVRRGYNTESFDMVATTERERLRRGEPTPQAIDGGAIGMRKVT